MKIKNKRRGAVYTGKIPPVNYIFKLKLSVHWVVNIKEIYNC